MHPLPPVSTLPVGWEHLAVYVCFVSYACVRCLFACLFVFCCCFCQFAIPHVTRTDERVMQVHSMLRRFLERDPQTRGRDLAVQVPVVVPITPRMWVLCLATGGLGVSLAVLRLWWWWWW